MKILNADPAGGMVAVPGRVPPAPWMISACPGSSPAPANQLTIGLVDDDPGILQSLERLLTGQGFQIRTFPSAETFLREYREVALDCVILDLELPGQGGLDLQDHLLRCGAALPVVFLSGRADIPASVRAMRAGAVHFLTKPADAGELLSALRQALSESLKKRAKDREMAGLRERFAALSAREMEVLLHVIAGKLNKQIAADLGISEQTVKIHRMRITEKSGMPSVAELVRASCLLDFEPAGC
jgi:FixJ family two-component response regulator